MFTAFVALVHSLMIMMVIELQISGKLGQMYSEMIFREGYIHCDPHPGNVLVRRSSGQRQEVEIVLLDHGLYTVSTL